MALRYVLTKQPGSPICKPFTTLSNNPLGMSWWTYFFYFSLNVLNFTTYCANGQINGPNGCFRYYEYNRTNIPVHVYTVENKADCSIASTWALQCMFRTKAS